MFAPAQKKRVSFRSKSWFEVQGKWYDSFDSACEKAMTTGATVRKATLGHEHPGTREKENAEAADAAVRKALRVETTDREHSGFRPVCKWVFDKWRFLATIGFSNLLETFDFSVPRNKSSQANVFL